MSKHGNFILHASNDMCIDEQLKIMDDIRFVAWISPLFKKKFNIPYLDEYKISYPETCKAWIVEKRIEFDKKS